MAGFDNETLFADNYDFRGVSPVVPQVSSSGQLPIGTGASPAIEVGVISSSTLTVGYSNPDITIEAGETVPTTFQTDSGSATPSSSILNIRGGPGITTSGSFNTVTINSVIFTNRTLSASVPSDSGSFADAAITLTTPVAPLQGEELIFVATTAGALVIQMAGSQVAHLGNLATSAGGTMTTTDVGDSITLRYQASTNDWWAVCSTGIWLLA